LVTPGRKITSELLPLVSSEIPSAQVIELQGYPLDGKLGDIGPNGMICFLDLIADEDAGLQALAKIVAAMPSVPVISIIPAKGACGASTFAFNLAAQLRKGGSVRTLLADLDPVTGTQTFQMKLKPNFSFLEILNQGAALDADIWRGVVQSYAGMDVLLSPDSPVEGAQEMGNTRPILDSARRLYDNVVADLGNAYGEWALSAARASDDVFLVTANELPALQAAQRVMNYYENNSIPRQRIHLVINRFNRDVGLTKEMIETALQSDIYQLINSDYEGVQRALLDGKPIQDSTSIGKQIAQMAARILDKDAGKQKKKAEKAGPHRHPFRPLRAFFPQHLIALAVFGGECARLPRRPGSLCPLSRWRDLQRRIPRQPHRLQTGVGKDPRPGRLAFPAESHPPRSRRHAGPRPERRSWSHPPCQFNSPFRLIRTGVPSNRVNANPSKSSVHVWTRS